MLSGIMFPNCSFLTMGCEMSPKAKMSPDLVDQTILACCKPLSKKVARVIAEVAEVLRVPHPEMATQKGFEFITKRIKALVKTEKLEGAGHLDRWRFSEIRLPEK